MPPTWERSVQSEDSELSCQWAIGCDCEGVTDKYIVDQLITCWIVDLLTSQPNSETLESSYRNIANNHGPTEPRPVLKIIP
jgi:hypothetical protein